MGNFFHFHPLVHLRQLSRSRPANTSLFRGDLDDRADFSEYEGLEFFGLCLETRCSDRGNELDRFSLSNEEGPMLSSTQEMARYLM
jgi:hypothetical protein